VIDPARVSACLVTKGDHDLSEIHESIANAGITDVVVWDNSQRPYDAMCYGRYAAVDEAKNDFIYIQDDDLVVPVEKILAAYRVREDRHVCMSNNRPDEGWPLNGIGSVFHRDLANCFQPYIAYYGETRDFYRISDVVFGYSNAYRKIWVGYRNLPWQTAPDRMHLQYDHYEVRDRARMRTLALPEKLP
jgi:hypothetical protein